MIHFSGKQENSNWKFNEIAFNPPNKSEDIWQFWLSWGNLYSESKFYNFVKQLGILLRMQFIMHIFYKPSIPH